jgi:hypothetical protein
LFRKNLSDWKSFLKSDSTEWLLEPDNPSVRYFSLTELLERHETAPEVQKTKRNIMHVGKVPQILSKQNDEGYWEAAEKFYTAKYKGTVWQLVILAELGADNNDKRVRKACEFILDYSQDHMSGGFSMWHGARTGGGRHSGVIPCLTGNMVWSLIKLGFSDDPRVERGINWITTYQRFDDGDVQVPKVWPYDKATSCFSKHSCHMGVVKALKALSAVPANKRSSDVKDSIEAAVEYLLIHHIYKRSHELSRVSKPGWLRFGFPLMYQTDVLEILGILTTLGYRDERMQDAVDLVVSKQDADGRWKLESTFNGRFQTNIEQKGKPSKWITLNALRVLKRFYG